MRRMWMHTLIGINPSAPIKEAQTDEDWYYTHRKNDLHSMFTHVLFKSFDSVGSVYTEGFWVGGNVKDEKELLSMTWEFIDMNAKMSVLSGWMMTDLVWPKLVNRSLRHGLVIPQEYKLKSLVPTRRFSEGGFYDVYNIYKQGVYSRPEVRLHEALELWTGEGSQPEHVLGFAHAGRLPGIDVIATLDRQIDLMEKVARLYD
jgi:hypothetical protein